MPLNLTAEDHLCLLLARGRFSPAAAKQAEELLSAGPRWNVLLERARVHGLLPLIYHRLRALDFRNVPEPIVRQLKDYFGINALRNELLAQELVRVLTQLSAANLPAIPLKGVALAESLYGDAALRSSADLDILIPSERLKDCLQTLEALGYTDQPQSLSLLHLMARYGKDCLLMREHHKTFYPLQIHCGLSGGGPSERRLLAEVWSVATPQTFHGAPAFAMSPEWQFLYLAVHAARHAMFPFKWLVDIDWLMVKGGVDWKGAHEKSRRIGWERAAQACLAACALVLGTSIPEPLATGAARARPKIFTSEPGPLEIPRETLFTMRLLPTLAQRLQFLAIRLFIPTPADCRFLRLPSWLFFLYWVLRPCRLAWAVAGWTIQATILKARKIFRRQQL